MNFELLESMPIAAVYIVMAALMLAFIEVGYLLSLRSRKDKDAMPVLSPMVGGLIGMLAFVLAFTFSMAFSQHHLRQQNVLEEANVVGTAYLRADLIDQQYGLEIKSLLRNYVDIRLKASSGELDLRAAVSRSVELNRLLWVQASAAATQVSNVNNSLMISAINNVIEMHEKRIAGLTSNRIPGVVWVALAAIIAFAMITLGAQIGVSGKRRPIAAVPLALAFTALLTLVVELNRTQRSLIVVEQQPMLNLYRAMERAQQSS